MVQFIDLWRGHPLNESIATPCVAPHDLTNALGEHVAAGQPVYRDQSAIRLGCAMRRAGYTIADLGTITTCGVHPAAGMHVVHAHDLANAIRRAELPGFGKLETISGEDAAKFYPKLFGRTGVIYIQDYWMRETDSDSAPTGDHIDVWNGYRSSAMWLMEWFSWAGYYSNYAKAREIWFWEVK